MAINQPSVNTVASLNGNFKELYADKIANLVPDNVVLMNLCKFSSSDKVLGNL